MSAPLATDYDLAERVALALAPLPGLAAVLLGGVGDDWLRAPAYPYAVVLLQEAESQRGQTARTIRVRLVVRAADAASKPDLIPLGYGPWTFADGLLEAARENLPAVPPPNHLDIPRPPDADVLVPVAGGEPPTEDGEFGDAIVAGNVATLYNAIPWVYSVVPRGGTVATRTPLVLLRVGAGPALDALVQAARDALSDADLGAPLESIATTYDPEPQYPVQSAELLVAFADPQAYGDGF